MKFSVMTFMFEDWRTMNGFDYSHMADIVKTSGGDGIEVFSSWFTDKESGAVDHGAIKSFTDNNHEIGLEVPCVDIICDLASWKIAEIDKALNILDKGIIIAHQLCCPLALVVGHGTSESGKGMMPITSRQMIAENLWAKREFARKHGVTLVIENFGLTPDLLCRADDCLDVINRANGAVQFVFDTGNFVFVNERADEVFDRLRPHIRHVHFKDWEKVSPFKDQTNPNRVGGFIGCQMGHGIVPNKEVARRLLEIGYDGWISLEAPLGGGDPRVVIERDLPIVMNWFAA